MQASWLSNKYHKKRFLRISITVKVSRKYSYKHSFSLALEKKLLHSSSGNNLLKLPSTSRINSQNFQVPKTFIFLLYMIISIVKHCSVILCEESRKDYLKWWSYLISLELSVNFIKRAITYGVKKKGEIVHLTNKKVLKAEWDFRLLNK